MEKLNTIQKVENLNEIYAVDDIGAGGTHHKYIVKDAKGGEFSVEINMQHGARSKENNPNNGLITTDLLEIARNQIQEFQSGNFATEDNAEALKHIEIALMYINKRTMDRYERNVLGTYNK